MRPTLGACVMLLCAALLTPSACDARPAPEGSGGHEAAKDRRIAILCYHDISSDPNAPLLTVSPEFLRRQIRECRAGGWTFVSLAQVLAHRDHPEALPERALVMTFDDGYRSFRELALPILRSERVPVTLAVITGFVDQAPHGTAPLMSWDELNEVAADSLVTLASHTHGLHRFETSNPYRDTAPSIASRRYILAETRYESREEYRARVRADLDTARLVFNERLHRNPGVLVWPYGAHNEMVRGLAAQAGFPITLALGGGEVALKDLRSGCLPRIMVNRKFHFDRGEAEWLSPARPPVRAANVDLDDVYSRDPRLFDERVTQLVARVRALGANTVFLSVCSDSSVTGQLDAAWCKNHQVFVRADIWSMVASRLAQARIKVWARVPTMNLSWAWQQHPEWRLAEMPAGSPGTGDNGAPGLATQWPNRLSPDLPEARRAAIDFLTDLAVYAPIDGMMFDDDAAMAANERLALAGSVVARDKAAAIDDLLIRCRNAVRAWRPDCAFARVVDAGVAGARGLDGAHAQDFTRIVGDYDLSVVTMTLDERMPANTSARRVERLARQAVGRWRSTGSGRDAIDAAAHGAAQAHRDGRDTRQPTQPRSPVLIEWRAFNPASRRWLPAQTLRQMTTSAARAGVVHFAVSPVGASADELPAGLLESKTVPELATGE